MEVNRDPEDSPDAYAGDRSPGWPLLRVIPNTHFESYARSHCITWFRRGYRGCLDCLVAISLGAITGHRNVEAVFAATAWTFIAVGATAADVGGISLVLLVVYAAQPLTPRQPTEAAFLALAGGLQTLLSIALWPVRHYLSARSSTRWIHAS